MKIVFVYDAVYPFVVGGAEYRLYEVAKYFAKSHDVTLYCMQYWPGESTMVKDGITYVGVCPAKELTTSSGRRSVGQAFSFALNLIGPIKNSDADLIVCENVAYPALLNSALIARMRKVPVIATWHEVWGLRYWREYAGFIGVVGAGVEWLSSKLPHRIISVSRFTAIRLHSILRSSRPLSIVPNAIDYATLSAIPSTPKKYDVVYSGRLSAHKNVQLLLRALRYTSHTALIIGEGPERNILEELARQLGVADRITFQDFTDSKQEAFTLWKKARVAVSPSLREGFGMFALEAAAMGIPVVTVDAPENATAMLVEDAKLGVVCKPSAIEFAKAISLAVSNSKELGSKAQKSAKAFDWNTILPELERLYLQTVQEVRT